MSQAPGVSAVSGAVPSAVAAAARDVTRTYGSGDTTVHALRGITVEFPQGQLTAVMGPSGSGKSTLMHILAGLDRPSSGSVQLGGTEIAKLNDKELTLLRRRSVGFVFQSFNLLPMLTADENIRLPLSIAGEKPDEAFVSRLIDHIGLRERLTHRPSALSGGQQQRVAVARALASRPAVVFADEPTGNLDSRSSGEVLQILRDASDQYGQTIVMVTHDPRAASIADRVVFLADGLIVQDSKHLTADEILDVMKTHE